MDMFKNDEPGKAKRSFLHFSAEEIDKIEIFLSTSSRIDMADRLQMLAKLYCANKSFRDSLNRLVTKNQERINRYARPEQKK